MKKKPKNLAMLLDTLEDTTINAESFESDKIYNVDIDLVIPNPKQPRKSFNEEALKELADSIAIHGIIQPLICKRHNDKFIIIAGERRYRASKLVGLETLPIILKETDDKKTREISLIENLQREDLNSIEEAEAIKELIDNYKLTQEEVAVRLGKSRSNVTNTLRLLNLDLRVKFLVRDGRLSAGHARALVPIEDKDKQYELALASGDNKKSCRDLEKIVKYLLNPELAPKKMDKQQKIKLSNEMRLLIEDMNRAFATKVRVIGNEEKGRIYIDYYTKDDLERIYELVEKLKK